jgi:hypothetical protein
MRLSRFYNWQIVLALALIVSSVILYFIHFAIFGDPHHIFIYMVGDIAFVPIEVLLVTLVVHRVLSRREKRAMLEKLNMVIGVFFSEVGTGLLTVFSDSDPKLDEIKGRLICCTDWSDREFSDASKLLKGHDYGIAIEKVDLKDLRALLIKKREGLMRLLENPNLLEHDSFTQLLQAVFHLTEELANRDDLDQLPDSDRAHLAGDVKRSYVLLVSEWIDYMKHLKNNYPYLFSLAMRTNPFDESASAVVR